MKRSTLHFRRDVREVTKIAHRFGFVFHKRTSRGHLQWRHPEGLLVTTSARAGDDPRAIRQMERDFKLARENHG